MRSTPQHRSHIEKRLRRLAGMSGDKLAAMHKAASRELWWVRCWNCKRTVEAPGKALSDMEHCPHCGHSLYRRDA